MQELVRNSKAKKLFDEIKTLCRSQHAVGDNAIKYALSVFVCKKCLKPVELVDNGAYRCPQCNKWRNRQQRIWLEFETQIDFRRLDP